MHDAKSAHTATAMIYFSIFISLCILEFISYVEHSVRSVGIILLWELRELVGAVAGSAVGLLGIVASALLISARNDATIVEHVGKHEVDRQASMLEVDAAADRDVGHEAAVALRLWVDKEVSFVVDGLACLESFLVTQARGV